MNEKVEVTVKIPKKLMETLEKLQYLGWTPGEFFDNAARSYLSGYVAELEIDDCKELEREHGEEMFEFQQAPFLNPGEMLKRLA